MKMRADAPRFRHLMRDECGTSSLEFAIVSTPFLFFVLGILQVSIFYYEQLALNAGIVNTADYLRSSFAAAAPVYPDAATLKTKVATKSGGLIKNNTTLLVDLRPLSQLQSAVVPIVDQTTPDYGASGAVLILRAQTTALKIAPMFSPMMQVRSGALIRRKTH